ncbi:MAG: PKD domain-containing protein, partial [Bacteroidales bacterium]|nr:PKD domain-containing protein [Bacteroidales bacterium]
MTIRHLLLITLTIVLVLSCTKENQPPTANFSIDPLSGNDETIFMFDASASSDAEDAPEDLMVIWDWEGDGEFDTQYANRKTADHIFSTPGEYMVTLVVKDIRGFTDTLSKPLSVASSNLPPEIPENPYPASGATNLGVKINMKWECSDPDGDFILYNIYFGKSNPPPVYASNQAYLGLDPEKLEYGTTYYWKVDAKDVKGN